MKAPVALGFAALFAGSVLACGAHDPSGTSDAHPEAVSIDFFSGGKPTAACTGTLISANVVLTAAHCADGSTGARVASSSGRASTVAEVRTYDYVLDHSTADHRYRSDLALLVLRSSIPLASYPQIQREAADGDVASHVGHRYVSGGAELVESAPMRVSTSIPVDHPMHMFVPRASPDAGGPLLVNRGGRTLIVGVMAGAGAKSGGGYVARLSAPDVQRWVRDIVAVAGGKKSAQSASHTASLHVLDDPPPPDPSSDPPPDPVAPPDSSSSSGSTSGSSGGDPSSSSGDTSSSSSSGDTSSSSSSGSSGAAVDVPPPPSGEDLDAQSTPPEGVGTKADAPDAEDPAKLRVLFQNGLNRTFDGQVWSSYGDSADDNFFRGATTDYASRHTDAAIVDMHGCGPGCLTDVPTQQQVQQMTANGQPMIMTVCEAGADARMGSSAQQLAKQYGVDGGQIYACTGLVSVYTNNSPSCDGRWVDGNGRDLSADTRQKFELHDCAFTTDPKSGKVSKQDCD